MWLNGEEIGSPEALVSRYREITSDLSMCCMLKLSLFAYVNLCALMMWENALAYKFNLSRIATVIVAMWSTEEKPYDELCSEMFDGLTIYAGESWNGTETEKEKFLQCMKASKPKKSKDTGEHEWGYLTYAEAKVLLEQQKNSAREEEECNFFKHLERLLLMCEKLAIKGKATVAELQHQRQLLEDYKDGVKVLKKVREELEKKREEDISIKKFVDLGESIEKFLEKGHYHVGNVRSEEINRKSIKYLLWLYYYRKIYNAQNGEHEEEKTNES